MFAASAERCERNQTSPAAGFCLRAVQHHSSATRNLISFTSTSPTALLPPCSDHFTSPQCFYSGCHLYTITVWLPAACGETKPKPRFNWDFVRSLCPGSVTNSNPDV